MKKYEDYKAIKKEYLTKQKEELTKLKKQINEATKSDILSWWITQESLTKKQLEKAQNNELTKQQIKELLLKKEIKQQEKEKEAFFKKCDEIIKCNDVKYIKINIEWKYNRMWGHNPTAEVWSDGKYTTGTASGCGYDKRSASTAEAFNKNYSILKLLYDRWEKHLRSKKPGTKRDILGYGSGYNTPYFEGGVGFSSHANIFKNLGFSVEWNEGKTWDCIIIKKEA